MSLRLLHVVPTYLPATRYGGPIHSVHGLCQALVRRGHRVRVMTTNVDGPGESAVPLGEVVERDGVEVTYYPCPALRRLYFSPWMTQAAWQQVGDFELVHLHSVFLWPTNMAARLAERAGVPYVVSPRGMLVRELIERKSRWAKQAWIAAFERHTLARAAALHLTAQSELREVRELGLDLPAGRVIENGVDAIVGSDLSRVSQAVQAAMAAGPFALFVGRINWKKGLDLLVPALDGSPLRLLLAGGDEEGHQARLLELARNHGVQERLHFLGEVGEEDRNALLTRARLLVLPSYNENFGNVVVEAMAAGCPVVVTQGVGAGEVLLDAGAGLVCAPRVSDLAEALGALWSDTVRREIMSRAGQDYARDRLSWDAVAGRMETLYEDILRERRS